MAPTALLQASPAVVGAAFDGRTVLLQTQDFIYLTLNETGQFLWDCLQSPQSVDGLVTEVTRAFAISPAECRPQVTAFVDDLVARQFLILQPASVA